jgi:hypothetical protein
MFAYLIIGIELMILYLVFWVVYLREPKTPEINAQLWGRYQGVARNSETQSAKKSVNLLNNADNVTTFLPSSIKKRLYRMAKLRRLKHRHHIKNRCYCKCHEARVKIGNWSQFPLQVDINQDINRQLAEKFLLVLNRTLNKFSVKIPH